MEGRKSEKVQEKQVRQMFFTEMSQVKRVLFIYQDNYNNHGLMNPIPSYILLFSVCAYVCVCVCARVLVDILDPFLKFLLLGNKRI